MRHGKKFCMICNPDGNGTRGIAGTEAVGRYYNQKIGRRQFQTGWIAVCEDCAEIIPSDFAVEYFDGRKSKEQQKMNSDPRICAGPYNHDWSKDNLVTMEVEGKLVDHCICSKCGAEGYWFGAPFAPNPGCTIPDGGLP